MAGQRAGTSGAAGTDAVDLLPSALQSLRRSVTPGISAVLRTRHADLGDFVFETPADLVLAFSAVEHLPTLEAIRSLLERVRAAASPGGVVAIGIDSKGNAGLPCTTST